MAVIFPHHPTDTRRSEAGLTGSLLIGRVPVGVVDLVESEVRAVEESRTRICGASSDAMERGVESFEGAGYRSITSP